MKDAIKLYSSNCYYCGRGPQNTYTSTNVVKYQLKYNGIDRVDSTKGYTVENSVSCCFDCNRAKSNLTQMEFFNLIERIYSFRVQRLSETSEYGQVTGNKEYPNLTNLGKDIV